MRKVFATGVVLCFLLAGPLSAQEVVAPAGGYYESANMSVSWTLGELAIETFQEGDYILTQGFHQTELLVVSVDELPANDLEIIAHPNPVSHRLNIKVENEVSSRVTYQLYDISGRLLAADQLQGQSDALSFENHEDGIYFLKVSVDNQVVKTFKVVKQ